MWIVIKFDPKKFNLLSDDLKKKIGGNFSFYRPKMKIERYIKNKLVNKTFFLLNNYIFCFHKDFNKSENLAKLKFIRGVKVILGGHLFYQKEISSFIYKLKDSENKFGYITKNFFELDFSKKYKFCSGPFTQKLFQIISLNKNYFYIDLGNFKTFVDRKKTNFVPIWQNRKMFSPVA